MNLFEVNLQPSRCLLLLLQACLGAAYAALWLCNLPWGLSFLVAAGLTAFAYRYYQRFIQLNHKNSIKAVRIIGDQWYIKRNSQWCRAWPKGELVVTSFLICCRLHIEGDRCPLYLILCADSAKDKELHAFRLKLMLDAHSVLVDS